MDAAAENDLKLKEALYDRQKCKEQVAFLTRVVKSFRQETPFDILVRSGEGFEPPVPAHRAVFISNSPILENMLTDSNPSSIESSRASLTANDRVTFYELNHEELKILIDFLYQGESVFAADESRFMKHVRSLFLAAHKYDIMSLKEYCESKMIACINEENVFGFLECSESIGILEGENNKLKDAAMEFIKENNHVAFRSEFEDYARNNRFLSVEVTGEERIKRWIL